MLNNIETFQIFYPFNAVPLGFPPISPRDYKRRPKYQSNLPRGRREAVCTATNMNHDIPRSQGALDVQPLKYHAARNNTPAWMRDPYFFQLFKPYSKKLNLPQADDRRPRPALWDICHGCILWLPKKSDIQASILQSSSELNGLRELAFDHPVVVLSTSIASPENANITFAIMTTSPASPARHMEIMRSPSRQYYLSPHNKLLLERNKGFWSAKSEERGSWISLSNTYTIDWEGLQCFAEGNHKGIGYSYRLQQKSFEKLLANWTNLPRSPWIETSLLWEFFEKEYINQDQGLQV
ncbi:hypothetical protein G7Y89_g765 [Cudoniella acicularis]|uniref:Uncharacterized protein n=1 Tax=Cudoniella acicularis TaxID=354080 RepID=A0A8H4W8K2_9HELO|nr:hypothetical protein G7Y89_g765 [Cudoniella acicularis]